MIMKNLLYRKVGDEMTNLYPWRPTTTPSIAAQDDPRYETPGGAQEKVDSSLEGFEAKTQNIKDLSVTKPKIAIGAVGGPQLDPALLQNYGDIAVQGQFQVVNEQLADIVINIKTLGAIGDGVSDDTAFIETARDTLKLTGGTIKLPAGGIYKITRSLILQDVNNVTIDGKGAQILFDFDGVAISQEGCHNNTFQGFLINGISKKSNNVAIKSQNSYDCNFINLEADKVNTGAFLYRDTSKPYEEDIGNIRFKFNGFYVHNATYGIRAEREAHQINIQNCALFGSTAGLVVNSTKGYAITNTDFEFCGIGVQSIGCYGYTISGCYFENNTSKEIEATNDSSFDITGNFIQIGSASVIELINPTSGSYQRVKNNFNSTLIVDVPLNASVIDGYNVRETIRDGGETLRHEHFSNLYPDYRVHIDARKDLWANYGFADVDHFKLNHYLVNEMQMLVPLVLKGGISKSGMIYSDGIPTSEYHLKGTVAFYINPVAGGYVGAVCIADGNPGTWKEFGLIQS